MADSSGARTMTGGYDRGSFRSASDGRLRVMHRRGSSGAAALACVAVATVALSGLLAACGSTSNPASSTASAAPTGSVASPATDPNASPGASPSSPPASSSPPSPFEATTPFGFAAKGMTHEVMAFVTRGQVGYATSTMDIGAISTVVYFGLTATADGKIATSNADSQIWRSGAVDGLIDRAHAAGSKVVFALGRFSWTASEIAASRALLASSSARAALARATADEVVRRGIDGVNVDFEPIPLGQAADFSDFVHRLRDELDARRRGFQLTVDLVGHFDSYDVPGLVPSVDAIYLMGYHYAGWWSSVAMSTAPMGGPRYDVAETVAALRRWVPAAKLIVGVPYYGHLWPTRTGAVHARTTGRGSDLQQPQAAALAAAHGIRYDPVEQVAWSAWQTRDCPTCAPHWVQVYFDDVRADRYKWTWIKAQGLLGTGIWTIGFEGSPGATAAALRAAFVRG